MGKGLGYFALLVGSLTIQTLPWKGGAPLGLLLAALVVGSREEPVTGALYGGLCGLCWGMALGRGGLLLTLLLGAAALGAGWMTRNLRLWRGWFLTLAAAGGLAGVVGIALATEPSWNLAGVLGWTVLVSPAWGWVAERGREGIKE